MKWQRLFGFSGWWSRMLASEGGVEVDSVGNSRWRKGGGLKGGVAGAQGKLWEQKKGVRGRMLRR